MKKNNKVFGLLGIGAYISNPNADFTMYPREVSGTFIMSPMSVKYPMRRYWDINGEKVLNYKSMKIKEEKEEKEEKDVNYRQLSERYQFLTGVKNFKEHSKIEVYKNLFQLIDVSNFGAVFAVGSGNDKNKEKISVSITGAVQFSDAINLYEDSQVVEYQVLSPFVNPESEGAKQTSLGMRKVLDEAHFFTSFSINPFNYRDIYTVKGLEDLGYTQEAYEKFKEACLISHSDINTMSKAGMENEFAIFIEMNEDCKTSLPNLYRYIKFYKEDNRSIIDLDCLQSFLNQFNSQINSIEVYLNPAQVEIRNFDKIESKKLNILTQELL